MSANVSTDAASFFLEIQGNLTKIGWAHAVNSQVDLDNALKSGTFPSFSPVPSSLISAESPRRYSKLAPRYPDSSLASRIRPIDASNLRYRGSCSRVLTAEKERRKSAIDPEGRKGRRKMKTAIRVFRFPGESRARDTFAPGKRRKLEANYRAETPAGVSRHEVEGYSAKLYLRRAYVAVPDAHARIN